MSFKGDLKKLPLADVFQSVHQNSLSGTLSIRDRRSERLVLFVDGFVTGCAAPEGTNVDLAGELVRRRVVGSKDVGRPSRFFRRKGSLKRSLKRKKILESGEFDAFTRQVILERIYECFLLEEGSFEFLEQVDGSRFDDDEQSAGIRIAPGEILMEAMRRIDEWKRIRRAIPSFKEVYVAIRQAEEDDDALQAEILALTAPGEMDLDQVLAAVPAGRFAACEALLQLFERGSLRVATAPEYLDLGRAAEERGDLEKAASCYARGLHYERGNPELNERRIAVLERLGRNQEAADERKLFAGSLLEQEDKTAAASQYSKAAKLSPSDPLPRERLLDLQLAEKDAAGAKATADELVELYLRLGLGESAKSVLPRLLMLAPKDRWLRTRMAEVHAKLHENSTAARIYRELAEGALEEGQDRVALDLLRKAAALHDDERIKALLEEVETGAHMEKRRRRRMLVALVVVLAFLGGALTWATIEAMALADLRQASREAMNEIERGPEGVLSALHKLEGAREAHPYTRAAAWSAELAEGLGRLYIREARLSDRTLELPPPPAEPPPSHEVLERIRAGLEPPEAPSLLALVQKAEDALAAAPSRDDEARVALTQARTRVRDQLIPALNVGGPNVRLTTEYRRALELVRGLLPRIHLAWGQVSSKGARALLAEQSAEQAAEHAPQGVLEMRAQE